MELNCIKYHAKIDATNYVKKVPRGGPVPYRRVFTDPTGDPPGIQGGSTGDPGGTSGKVRSPCREGFGEVICLVVCFHFIAK